MPAVRDFVRFHTGAPIVAGRGEAVFAVLAHDTAASLDGFAIGTDPYPDRSATLVIEVPVLGAGTARRWRGPGIAGRERRRGGRARRGFLAGVGRQPRAVSLRRRHRVHRRIATAGAAAQHRRGGLIMYVAVKGGETAIAHSLDLLADKRRGDRDVAELSLEQIDQQLGLAVDRVMTEGSCYDRALAALAIKQARGDLDRGDLPAARLSHDASAVRRQRAARHHGHGRGAAHLGHLQGHTGRPGAGPDLRLHPSAARLLAGRLRRAAAGADRAGRQRAGPAAGRRHPRARRAARAAAPGRARPKT